MKCFILILILLLSSWQTISAQKVPQTEEETALLFLRQLAYPQEKAYLHFDRDHYVAGDTVWYCGYLVDAAAHVPDTLSRYLYADLADPLGRVVRRAKIVHRNGVYAGYFSLPDTLPAGNYTAYAYTMFMQNAGEEYYFRRPLKISSPFSAEVFPEIRFDRSPGDRRLTATFSFRDEAGARSLPKSFRAGLGALRESPYLPGRNSLFSIPLRLVDTLKPGVAAFAYDRMSAFVNIPPLTDRFDVSFFPEGGSLVAGAVSTVGFKALNTGGLGEDVTGELFDSDGARIVSFVSLYRGMGLFSFIPKAGERYYALCTNAGGRTERFELPVARNDAPALRVSRSGGRLNVFAAVLPGSADFGPLTFVIRTRRNVLVRRTDDLSAALSFDLSGLPSGVGHVLLLDGAANILSERLFFCLNDDQADLRFTTDRAVYGRRERVSAGIRVADPQGNPLSGRFSVSVTDDADVRPDTARNILTDLLLTSDLRGHVESPAWYFAQDDPLRRSALDALMLTQGWRRYDIPRMLKEGPVEPEHPAEQGFALSGRVGALLSSRASRKTQVNLFSPQHDGFTRWTETDEEGRFLFDGFEYPELKSYFIQAMSSRGKEGVELLMDPVFPVDSVRCPLPVPAAPVLSASALFEEASREVDFIQKAGLRWTIENGMRTVHIDAVLVTAAPQLQLSSSFFSGQGKLYGPEFMKKNKIEHTDQLFSRLQRVRRSDENALALEIQILSPLNGRIWVPATVIVDGMIYDDFQIYDIPMESIESVEVVTAANGYMGTFEDGFLVITTRSEWAPKERTYSNRQLVVLPGYQSPAEFYSPKYETAARRNSHVPDLRTTLYWNPDVRTPADGRAAFEFYTSDDPATYSVVIEGVTDDGRIVRAVEKIVRQ